MARPWTFIVATLAVIGILAAPVASATLNVARADVLPAHFASRRGEHLLDTQFSQAALNPIVVAVPRGRGAAAARCTASQRVPGRRRRGPGRARPGRDGDRPHPGGRARSPTRAARSSTASAACPGHGPRFLVTGETAGELDFLAQIEDRAPWAAAFVFLATYLVLAARLPLGAPAAQGDRDEQPLDRRRVRRARVGVPGRPPERLRSG